MTAEEILKNHHTENKITRRHYLKDGTECMDWYYSYNDVIKVMEQYAKLKVSEACSCEKQEEVYEPYFGWCDVEGCENEGCCGGSGWREYGYWTLCSKHSDMARKGEPFPQMKLKSIAREKSRDPITGFLPINAHDTEEKV